MVGEKAADSFRNAVDSFCAGTNPAQNNLEERLDMVVAQLSAISLELHKLNDALKSAQ